MSDADIYDVLSESVKKKIPTGVEKNNIIITLLVPDRRRWELLDGMESPRGHIDVVVVDDVGASWDEFYGESSKNMYLYIFKIHVL